MSNNLSKFVICISALPKGFFVELYIRLPNGKNLAVNESETFLGLLRYKELSKSVQDSAKYYKEYE